jgi:O-antigen/teichoic acid export membrane protein
MAGIGLDRRLRYDFTWLLSGNVLYSACQWGIVVVLAKLGSAPMVGEYALGMAVCGPIVLFGNFQLRALLATDVQGQFTFGQYLGFRLGTFLLVLAAIAIAAASGQADARVTVIILLVGCAQVLDSLSETYYGLMQRHERMDRVSRSLAIKGPLALGLLAGVLYVTGSLALSLAGLILGRLAVLCLWDARTGFAQASARARARWDWQVFARLFRMALPLGIISTILALVTSVPRFFIETHRGTAELGIFAAIASLLSAGALVVAALGQSLFAPVAKAYAGGDIKLYRSFVRIAATVGAAIGGTAIVAALLFGPSILTVLFRPEYGSYSNVMVLLMIAGTISFIASGLGYVMTAARSLAPQIPVMLAALLTAAGASAWLIPRQGLAGAAEAVILAAIVQLAGTSYILLRIDAQMQTKARATLRLARTAEGAAQ